jgi:peptidyl-prolyl cis-trans isomerase C
MPRSLRSWFSLLLITALVPIPAAISQEKILATVNGKPLTEADMRLAAIEFAADLSVVAAADRDRMLLELLIEQQLVADAAQKANLDQKVDFADRVRSGS